MSKPKPKPKGGKKKAAPLPPQDATGPLSNTGVDEYTNLDEMHPNKFGLWTKPALKAYLKVRGQRTEGSFDELVAR